MNPFSALTHRRLARPVSGDVDDSSTATRASSPRVRRLAAALCLSAVSFSLVTGLAAPASAQVDAGAAYAYETVTCDSVLHTVTLDINTVGFGSGVYGGTELFPYELQEPVFVKVWEYTDGSWVSTSNWNPVPGVSHLTIPSTGTSFWYFQYAFQTPSGSYEYRDEWAGGVSAAGWYADQNGYQSLTSCVS
jgi:hypothetical protein